MIFGYRIVECFLTFKFRVHENIKLCNQCQSGIYEVEISDFWKGYFLE
jgi:hypothetical protein